MEEFFRTKRNLRILLYVAISNLIALFLIRFLLVPLLFNVPLLSPDKIVNSILDNLIATSVASVIVSFLIYWITPKVMETATVEIVEPYRIGEVLKQGRSKAKAWWFSGGTGRFNRIVTMPELAQASRLMNLPIEITMIILDPMDEETCQYYAEYRARARSGFRGDFWTPERVRDELYATIIAAYSIKSEYPMLKIAIALKRSTSIFRIDLNSQFAILTKEDPREPALKFNADTFFYNSFFEDLRLNFYQFNKLPTDVQGTPLEHLQVNNVKILLESLGLYQDNLKAEDLSRIIEIVANQRTQYG